MTVLLTVMLTFSNHAVASCKGVAKKECIETTACSWVDGYDRKDGVKVKGHCRTQRAGASVPDLKKNKINNKNDMKIMSSKNTADKSQKQ